MPVLAPVFRNVNYARIAAVDAAGKSAVSDQRHHMASRLAACYFLRASITRCSSA